MQKDLRTAMQQHATRSPCVSAGYVGDQMVQGYAHGASERLHEKYSRLVVAESDAEHGRSKAGGADEGVLGASPWTWNCPMSTTMPAGRRFVESVLSICYRDLSPPPLQLLPTASSTNGLIAVNRTGSLGYRAAYHGTGGALTIQLLKDNQSWRAFDHQNIPNAFMRFRSDRVAHVIEGTR